MTSGVYTAHLTNASGCDSTATLNLTINYSNAGSESVTACNTYSWNGTTYTTSGVYTAQLTNASGCDSTATLNLTINYSNAGSESVTACNTYSWNGNTYTTSGVYTAQLTNASGCDSTATLNLMINYSNAGSESVTACNTYSWNGTTYTTSGVYTAQLTNASGCDSTATLNLTINYSNAGSESVTACNTYTWNGTTYTTSGVYTAQLTNVSGCDSTATLNLTIKNLPDKPIISLSNNVVLSTQIQNDVNYQWVNCNNYTFINGQIQPTFSVNENGIYAVIVDNLCGADTSDCIKIDGLGNEEISRFDLKIFPNPTTDIVNIEVSNKLIGQLFYLYDYTGRIILKGEIISKNEKIDLTKFARGAYYFKIENEIHEKIIKQ
jgi:hypothetical protein